MPYKSKAQQAWANATNQPFAKEWNKATKKSGKKLPKKVKSSGKKKK